jgi:hypothetical protein
MTMRCVSKTCGKVPWACLLWEVWVRGLQVRGVGRDRQGGTCCKIGPFAKFLINPVLLFSGSWMHQVSCIEYARTLLHRRAMRHGQMSVKLDSLC